MSLQIDNAIVKIAKDIAFDFHLGGDVEYLVKLIHKRIDPLLVVKRPLPFVTKWELGGSRVMDAVGNEVYPISLVSIINRSAMQETYAKSKEWVEMVTTVQEIRRKPKGTTSKRKSTAKKK